MKKIIGIATIGIAAGIAINLDGIHFFSKKPSSSQQKSTTPMTEGYCTKSKNANDQLIQLKIQLEKKSEEILALKKVLADTQNKQQLTGVNPAVTATNKQPPDSAPTEEQSEQPLSLEERFYTESADDNWSESTEIDLSKSINYLFSDTVGFAIEDYQCQSTMCRIAITADNTDVIEEQLQRLSNEIHWSSTLITQTKTDTTLLAYYIRN